MGSLALRAERLAAWIPLVALLTECVGRRGNRARRSLLEAIVGEIVVRGSLEPQSIAEASQLADMAVRSRLYAVTSPEAALMILLTGRDLGLSASQALRGIFVVQGKPVVSSDVLVAAVRRSGLCDSWRTVETTDQRCVIETRRKGEQDPERETWTLDEARRAGLLGKDVWKSYPRDMLRHRCAAALARRVYPDVVLGCYAPGEIDEPAARVDVTVVESPTALDRLRDDLASAETTAALRAVYEEHRAEIAEMDVDGGALKLARDACHAVATQHGWSRTKADTDRLLGKGEPLAIDVAAIVTRYGAATTTAEVDMIAAQIAGVKLAKEARATLAAAHNEALSRIYCADASAWDARLMATDKAHEVAAAFVKRADAFEAAGVTEARWSRTADRLVALGVEEPTAFVEAARARRAA